MRRNVFPCIIFFCFCTITLSAQSSNTAKTVVDRAIAASASGEKSVPAIIADVEKSAESASNAADRRALYAFLGSLREQSGNYVDASRSYAIAAGISAVAAAEMPHLTAEQLVINAVRCALSAGDFVTAENYLASRVKDSSDPVIGAYVKLYSVWSKLCQAESAGALDEPLSLLRSYSTQATMEPVRPAVLLSLWYIAGDGKSADRLLLDYPQSPEAAIVSGTAGLLPAPFWFFSPRSDNTAFTSGETAADVGGTSDVSNVRQQLGLFRNEDNAKQLVAELAQKGFTASIKQETRSSGTVYYIVTVPENAQGTMETQLKNAGFDCYPIYE
jgi:hypothetical protein